MKKRIFSLLLAMVMLFSLTVFAADNSNVRDVTVTLNGTTVAVAKVVSDSEQLTAVITVADGDQSKELYVSFDGENLRLTVPANSDDVYVISKDVFAQNLPIGTGSDDSASALNDFMSSEAGMHVMMAVMKLAGALSPIMSDENASSEQATVTLPILQKDVDCSVTTLAPSAEVWKTVITDVLTLLKSDSDVTAAIEGIAASVPNADASAITAAVAEFCDAQLADVDSLAQTLGALAIKVATSESGSVYAALEAEGQALASVEMDKDEDGITYAGLTFSGTPILYTEFLFNDDIAAADLQVCPLGAELYFEFYPAAATLIGIPCGGIQLVAPTAELQVEVVIDGDEESAEINAVIVSVDDETVELVIDFVNGEGSVEMPAGNDVVISSMEEFQALTGNLNAALAQ